MRTFSSLSGPPVLSIAAWTHILCIVFSISMRAVCVSHYNFWLQTDQIWQIIWVYFFTFYFPINCFNIYFMRNCLRATNIAFLAAWRWARMWYFSLISATRQLRLFFTIYARLHFLTLSAVNNFIAATNLYSFLTAEGNFFCFLATFIFFITAYRQLFITTL